MELQLEELEADASEDGLASAKAARTSIVRAFEHRCTSRKPFPEYLPRECVVVAAPESCPCCGSGKLEELGEDGWLSVCEEYPSTQLREPVLAFTDYGLESLRFRIEDQKESGEPAAKAKQRVTPA